MGKNAASMPYHEYCLGLRSGTFLDEELDELLQINQKDFVALHKILPAKGILRMKLLIRKQSGSAMSTAMTNLSRGYSATAWKA